MAGWIARWIDCDRSGLQTGRRQVGPRQRRRPTGAGSAQADRTGYFSILLCNCQNRTVRWAVSIDSFR
jgi:hypothetical protein